MIVRNAWLCTRGQNSCLMGSYWEAFGTRSQAAAMTVRQGDLAKRSKALGSGQ
jgi:hypothetical protein